MSILIASLALLSLGAGPALATQGPIASYSFDAGESAGTVAEDVSGNKHEGTIEGAEWFPRGKYGGALDFDGANDCVSIPNTEDLQLDEEFTLEAWVRPAPGQTFAPIFFKEIEETSFYSYSLFLGVNHIGWLEGFVAEGFPETAEIDSGGPLLANTWSHVAFTSDGAYLRLYVNGALVGTADAGAIGKSEGPLYLGCWKENEEHYKGKIDEVRVYDRALGGGEVATEMSAELETPRSGPVASYAFDENTGTSAGDSAGKNDGTIEGATWTRGKYGSALKFDASEEDVVTIPTSTDLNLEDFTLEAWVKPSEVNELLPVIAKGSGEGFGYALYGAGAEGPFVPTGYITEGESVKAFATAEEELSTKTWTHIAVTSDGDKLRFYVNGKLVDTRTGANLIAGGGTDLHIGGDTSIFNPTYFDGKIDEVRLYDRALSEAEVNTDLHSGIDTPQDGPIAAYSMDAGTGSTLEDVTGAKHDGTIEGATWTDRGKYGKALEFDGENDCVTIPNTEDLQLSEEFTLEAWVRPQSLQEFAPIFFKEREGFYSYSLFLGAFESGHLQGYVANESPGYSEVESGTLPAKTWSHVAFTSDGAYLRLYVNGALVDTSSAREAGESEGPLYVGCWPSEGEHFEGRIDEVQIYDRALDGSELAGDMIAELQTPEQGPVASYAFDENTGTVAHDYAGEHDGTVEGATWTSGKFGSALDFDASEEDVVTIPTSPDLNLEDFTLEAWVKPTNIHQLDPVIAKTDPEGYGYELQAGGVEAPALPEGFITEGESVDVYSYSEDQLDENAWTHIAFTSDGEKMRFYVNGKLTETQTGDNQVAGGEVPLQIGGNESFVNPEFFDGKIDEIRIYNRALNEGEIATDQHSGIETPQQGPIAAYSFDEEGATAEDLTGQGHEGTIEGATWTDRGKYGGALNFDGVNDCVTIPESPEFQFLENEEFTLEAWVRPQGEGIEAILTQEDNAGAPWEDPFSYSMLVGGEEGPKGWLRKGGKSGHGGAQAPNPLPLNAWSHLALTDDGAKVRIYVNGELVGTEPSLPLTAAEGPLTIGCLANYGNFFKGRIDEVRIYNRSLDGDEIVPTLKSSFPVAITELATEVEANEVTLNGTARGSGEGTEYLFEYGPTTSYGNVVMGEEFGTNDKKMKIEEVAFNLKPETETHFRLVVSGPSGAAYGKDLTFTTSARTMSTEEEEEFVDAEESMSLISKEKSSGPGNFYGMQWTGDREKMRKQNIYQAVADSGAKVFRMEVNFEPKYKSEIEHAFEFADNAGITLLPEFGGGPFPVPGSHRAEQWVEYAEKLVHKWGPDNKSLSHPAVAWEIWNEPNMTQNGPETEVIHTPDADRFAEFFKEMAIAINKGSESGVQVLTPGLYGYRSTGPKPEPHVGAQEFLEQMDSKFKAMKFSNPYDAISLHPYAFKVGGKNDRHAPQCNPKNESECVKEAVNAAKEVRRIVIKMHRHNKGVPIWITELGFDVANPGNIGGQPHVTENMQKLEVKAIFSLLQNLRDPSRLNIPHAIYYNIQDDKKAGWAYHSGLRTVNGAVRPAWSAYWELTHNEACSPMPAC